MLVVPFKLVGELELVVFANHKTLGQEHLAVGAVVKKCTLLVHLIDPVDQAG